MGKTAGNGWTMEDAVRLATEDHCACGGQGPDDEPACVVCRIYHELTPRAIICDGEVARGNEARGKVAHLERLVAAQARVIDLYLHHESWCPKYYCCDADAHRCTCGYDDALALVAAAKEGT